MRNAERFKRKKAFQAGINLQKKREFSKMKRPTVTFSEGEYRAIRLATDGNLHCRVGSRAEKALSRLLQEAGVDYANQVPLGPYKIDFLLPCKTVVEVEGVYHESRRDYDKKRTDFLEQNGFFVLRIPAHEAHSKKTAELIRKMCLERMRR